MNPFLTGIIIIVVIMALLIAAGWQQAKVRQPIINAALLRLKNSGFQTSVTCGSYDELVLADLNSNRLAFVKYDERAEHKCSTLVLQHTDLVSAEIYEDGFSVNKVSRSNQAAGAAIGAIAFGGIGAIVGGLSASSRNERYVDHIELRVTTILPDHPYLTYSILKLKCERKSSIYEGASAQAQKMLAAINALIKKADMEANALTPITSHQPGGNSVVEQLTKWAELRTNGHISEEEFQHEKAKLLRL